MIALYVTLGVLVLLIFYVIGIYNQLVRLKVLVQEGWSGIGSFLQMRLDLIPNLVEVVKGYAGHENKTLTDVIRARNESITALTPEAQIKAAEHVNQALLNFKSLSEEYPELKADASFMKLQEELSVIEEKLNQSRRYYNGTVRDYNQNIAVFPKNLLAGIFNFKAAEFFNEDPGAAAVPKVSF